MKYTQKIRQNKSEKKEARRPKLTIYKGFYKPINRQCLGLHRSSQQKVSPKEKNKMVNKENMRNKKARSKKEEN